MTATPERSRTLRLLLWVLGTRALVTVAMLAGTYISRPTSRYPYWIGEAGDFRWQQVPHRLLDIWGRWDTLYYLGIAQSGYPGSYPEGGWVFHAAFFPFFPALVRGLSELLFGAPLFYCGIALANAMLALSVVYLDKLLRLDVSPRLAEGAVVALLCYPGSHFLSVVYPESTALFLSVFAFYCFRTGLHWPAAVAAGFAVIARPTGWLLLPALAIALSRGADGKWKAVPALAWLLVPVGFGLAFLGLQQQTWGDWLYFVHVQAAWNRGPSIPFAPLFSLDVSLDHHLFYLAAVAVFVLAARKKSNRAYLVLSGALLLLPQLTGSLRSIHRLLVGNFPLYPFAAEQLASRTWLRRGCVAGALVGLAILSNRWGAGMWPN